MSGMGFCMLLARQCERQDLTKGLWNSETAPRHWGIGQILLPEGGTSQDLRKQGLRYQTESQGI